MTKEEMSKKAEKLMSDYRSQIKKGEFHDMMFPCYDKEIEDVVLVNSVTLFTNADRYIGIIL